MREHTTDGQAVIEKWLARINNLIEVYKTCGDAYGTVSSKFTSRELIELRMILEIAKEINHGR